jgi:hypothetical protein
MAYLVSTEFTRKGDKAGFKVLIARSKQETDLILDTEYWILQTYEADCTTRIYQRVYSSGIIDGKPYENKKADEPIKAGADSPAAEILNRVCKEDPLSA